MVDPQGASLAFAAGGSTPPPPPPSGSEAAAILLMLIGEDEAAQVLGRLDPAEVEALGGAMYSVADVSELEVNAVLDEFVIRARKRTTLGFGVDRQIKGMMERALGPDRAGTILGRIAPPTKGPSLEALKWMEPRAIAALVEGEHPQLIALVLAHLEPPAAADVLQLLSEDLQPQIIQRVATLGPVTQEALEDIERLPPLALIRGLANADDGNEIGLMGGHGLGAHQMIRLCMVGAALGMADDDMGAEAVGDHLGGNIAGMRAGGVLVAILRADHQRAVIAQRRCHVEQCRGRADQRIHLFRQCALDALCHGLDLIERGTGAVHLPVSGNKRSNIRRHAYPIPFVLRPPVAAPLPSAVSRPIIATETLPEIPGYSFNLSRQQMVQKSGPKVQNDGQFLKICRY